MSIGPDTPQTASEAASGTAAARAEPSAACGMCGSTERREVQRVRDADEARLDFAIAWCAGCGSGLLLDPPDDRALGAFYQSTYYGMGQRKFQGPVQWLFDASKRSLARAVMQRIAARTAPAVLDVGCGTGQLLACFADLGADVTGIERPGGAGRAVRPELTILECDLLESGLPASSHDAVVIWHVIEHLREPGRTLDVLATLTRPDGLLAVATPNAASWQARLFGARWFHLDVPRHLHFLAHRALCRRIEQAGYRVESQGTLQLSQNVFGFVQSCLNAVFPRRPNRFYNLLRSPLSPAVALELCFWLIPVAVLAPLALLESLFAGLCGAGATSVIFARRLPAPGRE